MKYKHLEGLEFKHGVQDCYTLLRSFYRDNFGLELTDYARPDCWWDQGMNLYMDHYWDEGFRPFDGHPREWRPADLLLMAVRSPVANHAAIYLGEGKILHHFYDNLSKAEPYGTLWRRTTVAVLRHKDITVEQTKPQAFDLMEALPPAMRRQLQEAKDAGRS